MYGTDLLGLCLRATRVDECGAPPAAATEDALVVTKGFVTLTHTPVYRDGTEFTQGRADGTLCVDDQSDPEYRHETLSAEFCEVNPALLELLTGVTLEVDHTGDPVGYRQEQGKITQRFALEVWSELAKDEPCVAGDKVYGYGLFPFIRDGRITSPPVIQEGTATFTVEARTARGGGSAWGVGPYDVVATDALGATGPLLVAMTQAQHYLKRTTIVAPPCSDVTPDGYQAMPA